MQSRYKSVLNDIYMIAYSEPGSKADLGQDLRWFCVGPNNKPFVTFSLSAAKGMVTKLKKFGYRATVITVSAKHSTCLLDLKTL